MKGFVYSLTSIETQDIYIGSTRQELKWRFSDHKAGYKSYVNNIGNWVCSFEIFQKCSPDTIKINLLEEIEFKDIQDLLKAEQKWMDFYKENLVNKHTAIQKYSTRKEYKKAWYQQQRLKPSFLEANKQYNEIHKEYQKEYNEQYRLANRDKIKAQRSEMIRCECCDVEFIRSSLPKHNKSKKHLSKQVVEVIFLD